MTLTAASALIVAVARGHREALGGRFAIALPASVLTSKALKKLVPRRKPRLLSLTPYESFPSGHSAGAVAFGGALVGALGPRAIPVAVGLAGLVGGFRLHDREHRVSEVLIGFAIGLAGAGVAELVVRRLQRRRRREDRDV